MAIPVGTNSADIDTTMALRQQGALETETASLFQTVRQFGSGTGAWTTDTRAARLSSVGMAEDDQWYETDTGWLYRYEGATWKYALNTYTGTNAQRAAISPVAADNGAWFYATDTERLWQVSSGSWVERTIVSKKMLESTGPTVLTYGAVADGEFLKRSGTSIISAAAGGGGGPGTVTTVSVVTANGVSGSVADATTTPAITLTLGAITPTSVNGLTISASTGTLTITNGKTFSVSNTLTLTSTDGATLAIGGGGTLGTAAYTAASAYQPIDATLTAFAALTIAANSLTIGTGADAFSQTTFAANTFPARSSAGNLEAKTINDFALTFLDDANGAAVLTTIGGQPLDATLTALAAYNTNGFLTQTAADTFTGRSIAVHADGNLTITNGDGVAGNPTLNTIQGIKTTSTPQFASVSINTSSTNAKLVIHGGDTSAVAQGLQIVSNSSGTTANDGFTMYNLADDIYWNQRENKSLYMYVNSSTLAMAFSPVGNIGIGTSTWGTSAVRVLGILNGTSPTTSPAGMGQLWSNAGAGTWRGSGGTVTAFGPAGPHCKRCGYDFWLVAAYNKRYKASLHICGMCNRKVRTGPKSVLKLLTNDEREEFV